MNKRELILNSIIKAYLNENNPIGSAELANKIEVIPASTIRVYFKKLSDEGAITQLHISGGRIPTYQTMMNYWSKKLNLKNIEIKNLQNFNNINLQFEIYCVIFRNFNEILNNVINYRDKFIILEFDKNEIVFKFSQKIYIFLSNLIGKTLNDLEVISSQIGLNELKEKILALKYSEICYITNENVAFKIFNDTRFLNPNFLDNFDENLTFLSTFDNGFLGLKFDVKFQDKSLKMLCLGSVYENYEKYFNIIRKVA